MKNLTIFFLLGMLFCGLSFGQENDNLSKAASDTVQEAWVSHYIAGLAPGEDVPADIVVDVRGNVYVTGDGHNSDLPFGQDYVTVKYDAAGTEKWVVHSDVGGILNHPTAITIDSSRNVYVTGYSNGSVSSWDYATVKYDSTGVEQWVARYSGPGSSDDKATDLALDGFGNVYVTGSGNGDYTTIMYDSTGVERWVASYNGPGNGGDYATAIELQLVGNKCENVYITGYSLDSGNSFDYATVNYSPEGIERWVARYNGPGNNNDMANDLVVDFFGNVYVTGYSGYATNKSGDYATVKYNAAGVEQWVSRYNGPPGDALDDARAIGVDRLGNVYVTGISDSTYSITHYTTLKYDTTGVQQWVARYPTSFHAPTTSLVVSGGGDVSVAGENSGDYVTLRYDPNGTVKWVAHYKSGVATALASDRDGNVYVTGKSEGIGTGSDYATLKYNFAGVEQWVARHSEPGPANDQARALALDEAGNVYVAGSSVGPGTASDYATVKYDAEGAPQWVARYNHFLGLIHNVSNGDHVTGLAVDDAGNVYVTGDSWDSVTANDYATVKYNAAGVEQWVARYNGPGNFTDEAHALVVDAAGNVYVTGSSSGSSANMDYTTVKYNSAGVEQWVARYDGPGQLDDAASALTLDESGNVYVTGYSSGSGSLNDYTTVKYNSAGVEQWVARYNGPGNDDDQVTALALDDSGNVYVTGFSNVSGNFNDHDYATVKYNSNGIQQWVARYNGPGDFYDAANALAVDSAGNVYVTGSSLGSSTSLDYATVKYNSAGVEQWVARYNGLSNGNEEATALAVDGAGKVYVTGGSTGDNYATVKYDTAGVRQWVADYNYPGDYGDINMARALALDRTGNVYVTGSTQFGWSIYTTIKYIQSPVVSVEEPPAVLPINFELAQNYPNPFNPATTIQYGLPHASRVTLRVYNILGEEVATLLNSERKSAGNHVAIWDGRNNLGEVVASGIYVYRIQAGNYHKSRKMVLLQ